MKSKIILLLFLLSGSTAWAKIDSDDKEKPESQEDVNRKCDACGESESPYIGDIDIIVDNDKGSEGRLKKPFSVYFIAVCKTAAALPDPSPSHKDEVVKDENHTVKASQQYCACSH